MIFCREPSTDDSLIKSPFLPELNDGVAIPNVNQILL